MPVRRMMKSKIHRATVTGADVNYEGSITIDEALMDEADILAYEAIDVLDVNNGARLTTYVIPGERGSGTICINGAAAHLVKQGDLVILVTYTQVDDEAAARNWHPQVVFVDEHNRARPGHAQSVLAPLAAH